MHQRIGQGTMNGSSTDREPAKQNRASWVMIGCLLGLALIIAAPPSRGASLADAAEPATRLGAPANIFTGTPQSVPPGRNGTMKILGQARSRWLQQGGESVTMDLPDGRVVTLDKTSFQPKKNARATWRGKVRGHQNSLATLSVRGAHVAGRIRIENEIYEVRPVGGGDIEVEWIDQNSFPACDVTDSNAALPADPGEGSSLGPAQGGTPDPEAPGTPDPEEPGNPDPEESGSPDPEEPGTEEPGTTDPEAPGGTDPEAPGSTDPEAPGSTDPEAPGSTDPEEPGSTDPEEPGTTDPESSSPEEQTNTEEPTSAPTSDPGSSPLNTGTPDLKLLVLYDPAALAQAGDDFGAMETQIDAAVATINTTFASSQVNATATLAHTQLVTHPATSGNELLSWLESDPGVAALRSLHGADLVSIITHYPGFCGVGNLQRVAAPYFSPARAFQVTDYSCAVGNLTFVHETGHNLGMEHNPEISDASINANGGASYAGSFGHWDNSRGSRSQHFRSVMSYGDPCTTCIRLAHFSNPNVEFSPGGSPSGLASGIIGNPGITDGRNNALTASLTTPVVANFRADVPSTGSEFFPIGHQDDDAQENNATGAVQPHFTAIELGYYPASPFPDTTAGLRFNNLTIPRGAYITEAWLEFTANMNAPWNSAATISVEDAANPAPFAASPANISSRTRGSSVAWSPIEAWSAGQSYATPSVVPLVQEIIDRPDWNPYQAMAFIIHDTSGGRRAYSFNSTFSAGHTNNVPRLHVEWSSCGASRTLPGGATWSMVSVPCANPRSTVADVFSELNIAEYGFEWAVLRYEPLNDEYLMLAETDTLQPGNGYWYLNYGDDYELTLRGAEVGGLYSPATVIPLQGSMDGTYNFVGHTSAQSIPWAEVRVLFEGNEMTLDEVNPDAICRTQPGDPSCIMSREMAKYISGNYATYNGMTPGMEGSLNATDGFWVRAFKSGVSLKIPMYASSASDEPPATETRKKRGRHRHARGDEWSIRLTVESGGQTDNGNLLGQLADAVNGIDHHDLQELAPQDASWLSLTFWNRAWKNEDVWGYTSDFRAPSHRAKGNWKFKVRGSEDKQEATLRWTGDEDVIRRARLIDKVTGEKIRLRDAESYTFPLTDGERRFRLNIH
jgi:Metallo-peptidase family M12B Reprolysin-like